MKKHNVITSFFVLVLFLASCGSKPNEVNYESTTGTVNSGKEAQISLEDGASVSIPKESLNSDVSIKIERNPEKSNSLPPLPDDLVPIGDFYNFEVTSGTLLGPVDVTLPYNPDKIPSGDGSLVYAIPTKDGWEIRPVNSQDNTATIYTDALGDPLIAWHFVNQTPDENVCGSSIDMGVIPIGDKFKVFGRIIEQPSLFPTVLPHMGDITVNLQLNGQGGDLSRRDFSVLTSKDGTFTLTLDPKEVPEIFGSERGWNWLFARAQCYLSGSLIETVEGFAAFQYFPSVTEQPATPTSEPTTVDTPPVQPTIPISTPRSLTDNIPVPNVVGMSFEDAKKTLEDLGFHTVWIDGTSKLELGKIYSQAPKAGALAVPHRTTVVLYRTTEVDATPPECAQFNLTPEECANVGDHVYNLNITVYKHCEKAFSDWSLGSTLTNTLSFSKNSVEIYPLFANSDTGINFIKLNSNKYSNKSDTRDQNNEQMHHLRLLTFTVTGFVVHYSYSSSASNDYYDCWEINYVLEK